MKYKISHPTKTLKGTIKLEGSKSITNRVLIIKALCKEKFKIINASPSDDSQFLKNALSSKSKEINIGAAGTAMRFLTAFFAIKPGMKLLTGIDRMKERPISDLVNGLRQLGADIKYAEKENYPPLVIKGKKINGGTINLMGNKSSQFVSALLLISPKLKGGLVLKLKKPIVSMPYIEMTLEVMAHFGISYSWKNNIITIPEQNYRAKDFYVEADWSAASYFYEIAALSKNAEIKLMGLKEESLQGDFIIQHLMKPLGVSTSFIKNGILLKKSRVENKSFYFDFTSCPDLTQTVLITCAGLGIQTKVSGIEHLRIKETDRIKALQKELRKSGINLIKKEKIYFLSGRINEQSSSINTYKDHRMAMAFAPLSLKMQSINIENPKVISKSYKGYWQALEKLGFKIIKL